MGFDLKVRAMRRGNRTDKSLLRHMVRETAPDMNIAPEELEEKAEEICRDTDARGAVTMLAFTRGKPCGFAIVTPYDGRKYGHVGSLRIGVTPDYRGKGVARELLAATIRKAIRSRKFLKRIEATPYGPCDAKRALFEGAGFQHEGTARNAVRKLDGSFTGMAMFGLDLEEVRS